MLNVRRINAALRKYSPHGLCGGRLVIANGDASKTMACTVGCLVVDVINRGLYDAKLPSSGGYIGGDDAIETVIQSKMCTPNQFMREAIFDYYGVTSSQIDYMMDYNDACIIEKEANAYAPSKYKKLPQSLTKTILSLRKVGAAWLKRKRKSKSKSTSKSV